MFYDLSFQIYTNQNSQCTKENSSPMARVRDESSVARLLRDCAVWAKDQSAEREGKREKQFVGHRSHPGVRSSVGQTVDSFVWVYTILSHSPIHVRFSCVFFTRDELGLEPQRQSACQQGAGKRLVFNLLRPDSIAWNCGREARSFSPDSLWIFGSRLLLFFFFFLPLPLSSTFFFLHLSLYDALLLLLPSPLLLSLSAFSLSRSPFFHESLFRFRTFTSDIYLGKPSRLKLLSTSRFYLARFYTCAARPSGRIFRRASVILFEAGAPERID